MKTWYLSEKETQRERVKKTVAENLRWARNAKGISLECLAIELEVDYRTVCRWEHAETDITLFDASRCAKILKMPLEQLLSD